MLRRFVRESKWIVGGNRRKREDEENETPRHEDTKKKGQQ
jgi:hypothetical protein